MPIDTSIYGLQQTPPAINPFAIAMQMQNMAVQRENALGLKEQRRLLAEQRQNALDDRTALDTAVVPGADLDGILAKLPGHMHAGVRKQWAEADKAAQDANDARAKAGAAEADYMGTLAATVKSYNYDPQAASIVLAHAKAQGHDTAQLEQQIAQDPSKLPQIVDAMIQASPKQRELMTGEKNATSSAQTAATGAKRLDAELPGITADALVKQQVAAGTTNGLTPVQQSEATDRAARRGLEQQRVGIDRQRLENEQVNAAQLTPEGVDMAAKQFAMTGQMIALGNGSAKLKSQIINRAADIYKGLDLASQRAAYDASKGSLVTLQKQRDALGAFEDTALKNLSTFLDLAKKVPDTGSPALNQPLRYANEKMFGGDVLTAYNTARRTVIPEFAKILANPGLSGQLSDTARKEIEDVVSGNATLAQTIAAAKVLQQDTVNRRTSYDDQIKAIQGRIAAPPGQSAAPAATDTAAPATTQRRPIPGIPGGMAELRNGKWIRVQ